MTDDAVTSKLRRGAFWASGGTLLQLAIRIACVPILARLIAPADFGVFASLFAVSELVELGAGLGLSQAAIRAETLSTTTIRALHATMAAVALAVFAALFFGAAPLTALLGFPDAVPAARAMAAITALSLLVQPMGAVLVRRLEFQRLALFELLAALLGTAVVGVTTAALGWGIGSLLASAATALLVRSALIAWTVRDALGFSPRLSDVRPLLASGAGQLASQSLALAAARLDYVVLGRVLGATQLGYYQRAYQLMSIAGSIFRQALGRLAFPTAAALRSEPERLRATYRVGLSVALVFLPPAAATCAVLADELVPLLLGGRWLPIVPSFRVFCLGFLFQPISLLALPAVQANGRMRSLLPVQAIHLALVLAGALAGSRLGGVLGASIAVVTAMGLHAAALAWLAGRTCDEPAWRLSLQNLPALLLSTGATLAAVFASARSARAAGWEDWGVLFSSNFAAGLTFVGSLWIGARVQSPEVGALVCAARRFLR